MPSGATPPRSFGVTWTAVTGLLLVAAVGVAWWGRLPSDGFGDRATVPFPAWALLPVGAGLAFGAVTALGRSPTARTAALVGATLAAWVATADSWRGIDVAAQTNSADLSVAVFAALGLGAVDLVVALTALRPWDRLDRLGPFVIVASLVQAVVPWAHEYAVGPKTVWTTADDINDRWPLVATLAVAAGGVLVGAGAVVVDRARRGGRLVPPAVIPTLLAGAGLGVLAVVALRRTTAVVWARSEATVTITVPLATLLMAGTAVLALAVAVGAARSARAGRGLRPG